MSAEQPVETVQLIQFSDDEEQKEPLVPIEGPEVDDKKELVVEEMKEQIVEEKKKEQPESPVSKPSDRSQNSSEKEAEDEKESEEGDDDYEPDFLKGQKQREHRDTFVKKKSTYVNLAEEESDDDMAPKEEQVVNPEGRPVTRPAEVSKSVNQSIQMDQSTIVPSQSDFFVTPSINEILSNNLLKESIVVPHADLIEEEEFTKKFQRITEYFLKGKFTEATATIQKLIMRIDEADISEPQQDITQDLNLLLNQLLIFGFIKLKEYHNARSMS